MTHNNRFKFRVWDVERKQFIPGNTVLFSQNGEIVNESLKDRDLIIQQCTNVTDELGNAIYEGDIIRVSYFETKDFHGHFDTIVAYQDGYYLDQVSHYHYEEGDSTKEYGVNIKNGLEEVCLCELCIDSVLKDPFLYEYYTYKKVGNIFENPELLESNEL